MLVHPPLQGRGQVREILLRHFHLGLSGPGEGQGSLLLQERLERPVHPTGGLGQRRLDPMPLCFVGKLGCFIFRKIFNDCSGPPHTTFFYSKR